MGRGVQYVGERGRTVYVGMVTLSQEGIHSSKVYNLQLTWE